MGYLIIDDKNLTLPRHITEEAYLLLPLRTKVLYQLECEDGRESFIGANGEPADSLPDTAGSADEDIEEAFD